MSSEREWIFRIRHILEAIDKIRRYTSGLDEEAFTTDSLVIDAVVRNFQVIGEAARGVPAEVQATFSHIPWASMQKMRHVLVHDYDRVEPTVVWITLTRNLPPLVPHLEALLRQFSAPERP